MGFKERDARAIFAKCRDTADCFSRINRAEAVLARNKKPVENKLGFLREAIENDWQVGRKTNRETTKSKGIRLENKITNSRQVSREKEETKAVDSFDDSMTPIGEIVKPTLSKILEVNILNRQMRLIPAINTVFLIVSELSVFYIIKPWLQSLWTVGLFYGMKNMLIIY